MRLDRYLANAGLGSRSTVRELIHEGRVNVDGLVIRDSGAPVGENGTMVVQFDGQPVIWHRYIHVMLNKPAGLITAMEDPRHPTVASLIPGNLASAGLFPVGRLDRDATGLLILTNDGTLGHRLASPHWAVWKNYAVTVEGKSFSESDRATFSAGILLADGQRCRPAILDIAGPNQAVLSIHEGKFHQVKKMMLATGRRITVLHRLSVGSLLLDKKLAPGECRELSDQEAAELYGLVELPVPN
jgi:16S rRNA pseudouridine516 synthase